MITIRGVPGTYVVGVGGGVGGGLNGIHPDREKKCCHSISEYLNVTVPHSTILRDNGNILNKCFQV